MTTGPRNRPTRPKVCSPPRMPNSAQKTGSREAPPTSAGCRLARLDRYEARALSRRRSVIRALDAALIEEAEDARERE
jgi:hypothetical protein